MILGIQRLRDELGVLGFAALGLLGVSTLFHFATVRPLEEKLARLDRALEWAARDPVARYEKTASKQDRPAKLGAYYAFLESDEGKAVWLAKIHSIAAASGIELRTGEYRLADSPGRVERYQVTLPLSGTYTQIWMFLESVLAEIPMLSLDQVSLRRKTVDESRTEAEVCLTLHLLKR